MISNGFLAPELAVLRRLTTPEKIQRFMDEDVGYNKEKGGATCRGPRRVLRDRYEIACDDADVVRTLKGSSVAESPA